MRSCQWVLLLIVLGMQGCISVQPCIHFEAVQKLSRERGQPEVVWTQTPEEEKDYAQQALEIALDGLTRNEAARIAVLNNPTLKAEFGKLGLAAADLAQAKLPRNPSVDALVAVPISIGNSSLGLAGWLSDLWQLPRQKRVTEIAAHQAEYEVAWHVLLTAFTGARAWDEVVSTRRLFAIEKELLHRFSISDWR